MYLEKEELKNAAKAGRIILMDDVDAEMLYCLTNWYNLLKKPGEIWISTYGGEAGAARAITGFINAHAKDFKCVIGFGQVFSAGAEILLGSEVKRCMEKGGSLLFHQTKSWSYGKESATDARNTVVSLEWENQYFKATMKKRLKDVKFYEKISREIDEGKDVIFSSEEALKHGIIDKIL